MALKSRLGGSLWVGVQTLSANPLRTVLSTLGVIMGVGSLVAVLSIGDGVEAFAREQIERTTDLQAVLIAPVTHDVIDDIRVPRVNFPSFNAADVASLGTALGAQGTAALLIRGSARYTPDTGRTRGVSVTATTPSAAHLIRDPLSAGRFFSDEEVRDSGRVIVVSASLANLIAPKTVPASVVGKKVRLEGVDLEVIGVAPDDSHQSGLAAFVPATIADVALAPSATPRAPNIYVRASDIVNVPRVKQAVSKWTSEKYGSSGGRVTISGGEGLRLDQARQSILIFKIVMGAFAGISLIVGGIGIMNVLLAAVTERTREIGIRKATGARNRDILAQFLAESVAITGVGAVIGVLLGLATAFSATAIMRAQTRAEVHAGLSWETLTVAALVCIVTGLAFGTYPALRASRLSPIDAIRHE